MRNSLSLVLVKQCVGWYECEFWSNAYNRQETEATM
jgi:hypothetical protein